MVVETTGLGICRSGSCGCNNCLRHLLFCQRTAANNSLSPNLYTNNNGYFNSNRTTGCRATSGDNHTIDINVSSGNKIRRGPGNPSYRCTPDS